MAPGGVYHRVPLFLVLLMVFALLHLLPYCVHPDVGQSPAASAGASGLHVVLQVPLMPNKRYEEYLDALLATLRHGQVSKVHILTESVAHQLALYEVVPEELQGKMQTLNIARRLTYADAVNYANHYLANTTTMLCNADVSPIGGNWDKLTPVSLANRLYGLTRHERHGCALECDCTQANSCSPFPLEIVTDCTSSKLLYKV